MLVRIYPIALSHAIPSRFLLPLPPPWLMVTRASSSTFSFPPPQKQQQRQQQIERGWYRHYKNGALYRVIDVVLHTETQERMVLYEELHSSDRNPDRLRFVRPLDMFTQLIQHENAMVPRFKKVHLSQPYQFSPPIDKRFMSTLRNPSKEKRSLLCADVMKYQLMNTIQGCIDRDHKINKRVLCYQGIFTLLKQNKQSNPSAQNLYVLIYSKYYTTRFMVQKLTRHEELEDDEQLKQRFKELCEQEFVGLPEFDSAYWNIVKEIQNPKVLDKFSEINKAINMQPVHEWSDEYKTLFFIGTSETDIYLERKLNEDVDKFKKWRDKILEFLQKYRFVNGWITNAGLGLVTYLFYRLWPGKPAR